MVADPVDCHDGRVPRQGPACPNQTGDDATIQALLERLVKFRPPRPIALRQRVDGGERLTDDDVAFLTSALRDAQQGSKCVARKRY